MVVHHILVASYTNDIKTLRFDDGADAGSASLSVSSSTTVGHHPSWITSLPKVHPTLAWTGLEQSDGRILSLKIDEEGKVEIVGETSSGGRDPCSLLALGDELLVANYSSGNIISLPLTSSQLPPAPTFSIQFSGTGPDKSRQEASHPHQVIVHEANEELLVPDLGSDVVHRLKKNATGAWKLAGHVGFELGGGPRHVAFHDGDLFTVLELSSKVVRHRFPALPEKPTFVKSTPTMSKPLPRPNDMLAAEILIPSTTTAFPTPYLYLSNRNDPSEEGDIISIFAIAERDSLELVTEVRTGLKHVRGIVFGGVDDRFLIVGGAQGGGVKVYERINGGKDLQVVASDATIEAPTGFLWV